MFHSLVTSQNNARETFLLVFLLKNITDTVQQLLLVKQSFVIWPHIQTSFMSIFQMFHKQCLIAWPRPNQPIICQSTQETKGCLELSLHSNSGRLTYLSTLIADLICKFRTVTMKDNNSWTASYKNWTFYLNNDDLESSSKETCSLRICDKLTGNFLSEKRNKATIFKTNPIEQPNKIKLHKQSLILFLSLLIQPIQLKNV